MKVRARENFNTSMIGAVVLILLGLLGVFGPSPSGEKLYFSHTSYSGLNQTNEYSFGKVEEKLQRIRRMSLSFQLQMTKFDSFRDERIQIPVKSQVISGAYEEEIGSDVFQWLSSRTVVFAIANPSLNDVRFEVSYQLKESPCGFFPSLANSSSEVFIRSNRLTMVGILGSKSSREIKTVFDSEKCKIETDARTFYGQISDANSTGRYLAGNNMKWPQTIFTTDPESQSGFSIRLINRSILEFCLAPCLRVPSPAERKLEVQLIKKSPHVVSINYRGDENLFLVTVDNQTFEFPHRVVGENLKLVSPVIGASDETRGVDDVQNFLMAASYSRWQRPVGISLVVLIVGLSWLAYLCFRRLIDNGT